MEIIAIRIDIGEGKVRFAGEEAVGNAEPALLRGAALTIGHRHPGADKLLAERL